MWGWPRSGWPGPTGGYRVPNGRPLCAGSIRRYVFACHGVRHGYDERVERAAAGIRVDDRVEQAAEGALHSGLELVAIREPAREPPAHAVGVAPVQLRVRIVVAVDDQPEQGF